LPVGTKIGGGYFVGFVGMPNPCRPFSDPLLAYGEPLECISNPRGEQAPGFRNWPLTSCLGNTLGTDNSGCINYFARTWPRTLPKNALDSKCMLKAGVPIVQQAHELADYTWPNERMFVDGFGYYPYFTYSYSIAERLLAVEDPSSQLYTYLASNVYGKNNIHVMWALIVAPEDIEIGSAPGGQTGGSRLLSWGMMQGCHIPDSTGKPQVDELVLEEIPTYPVDGLLTTRIHDGSSRTNPSLWFRQYVSDATEDPNAYTRFSFGNGTSWLLGTNKETINTDIDAFQQAYSEMWVRNNPLYSAIYQISNINQSGLYGHNDWYIPSITELNYIYANVNELNANIFANDDQILGGTEYWSSTSVSRLVSWGTDPNSKDQYIYENISPQLEPYLSNPSNRLRSTNKLLMLEIAQRTV